MSLSVLLLSTALFAIGLLLKHTMIRQVCVLCGSICGSWIILLIVYKLGHFHDRVLLALLIGQSVTGVFYLARRHVPEVLRIFTLPFFLSLTVLAYWTVGGHVAALSVLGFLFVLWVIAYVLFISRNDQGKHVAAAVMKCCEAEDK